MDNVISPAAFNYTLSALEEIHSCIGMPEAAKSKIQEVVLEIMEDGVVNGYDTFLDKFP